MAFNTIGFVFFIGIIATIALTVLAYIFIIPEAKRERLNTLGKFIHDIFNFKFLIIEKIMQFLYVIATIATVCIGISMLFGINIYYSEYFDKIFANWYGLYGLLLAIVGPFAVRIVYEALMLLILLVKNVIQINKKIIDQTNEGSYKFPRFKELVAKENFDFVKNARRNDCAPQSDNIPQPHEAQSVTDSENQ